MKGKIGARMYGGGLTWLPQWIWTRLWDWCFPPSFVTSCSNHQAGEFCKGRGKGHGACADCGAWTCGRRRIISPESLKRVFVFRCHSCVLSRAVNGEPDSETALRERRTRLDWEEVTTPLMTNAIIPEQMPDYEGKARAAIRAFYESHARRATVPAVSVAAVQGVILALGFGDEMYAEQRAGETVLRRVAA